MSHSSQCAGTDGRQYVDHDHDHDAVCSVLVYVCTTTTTITAAVCIKQLVSRLVDLQVGFVSLSMVPGG